jgi:4-amino-4-deoxy-L-arabinose transferase-like glycosyltransferase
MTSRRFAVLLTLIVLVGAGLRGIFPTADPPWRFLTTVGIVWHDEGAWVHNARNKALFGQWSEDQWNPMYIAPVFTGLEYASFATFGVGTWQARLVSEVTGLASVLLLAFGVRRLAGRGAGVIAGMLLATDYVYVMWNRAALMEASMVAFMVAAWYCYVRAQTQPWWGALAGACALLAYFSKAAAIFFVVALGIDAVVTLTLRQSSGQVDRTQPSPAAARATLIGLVAFGVLALALFVIPHWSEYRFYNWQMSVTRKPSYDFQSIKDRITWFPIVHDIFTRTWFSVVVGLMAIFGAIARWRTIGPPERLLALWVILGAAELILHDTGNERRFIFFIPALVALTSILLARDRRLLPLDAAGVTRRQLLLSLPAIGYGLYVVFGAILRLAFLYEPGPGVRLSAAVAAVGTVAIYLAWPRLRTFLAGPQWSTSAAVVLAAVVAAAQIGQFVVWARGRTYKNYQASVELGMILPPGTLVHGKLANGLSLENRIRPVFVGREFGNYADRKHRDDVRYILTYVVPYVGYEGTVIRDVLEAYPNRAILKTFDVAEKTRFDQAVLIDKFGDSAQH